MEFIRLQVVRAVFAAFVVLLCGELSNKVKCDKMVKVYNVGDNITLDCHPQKNDYYIRNNWYRNRTFIANRNGISTAIDDPRLTRTYLESFSYSHSLFSLSISNINRVDSATYNCFGFKYLDQSTYMIQSYDVRVIGCTCRLTDHDDTDKDKVICQLENYRAETPFYLPITINKHIDTTIYIDGNTFAFAMLRHQLYNSLHFQFNPYTDVMSSITCMLPAQFTSPQPSTRYPTTPLIPTTQNGRSKASYSTSQEPISGAAISTTEYFTRQNKKSSQDKNLGDSDITMIIVIAGSVFILILIVLIIVLRCKQTKNRQGNKHNGIASLDSKDTKEHPEACYESVDDASQRGLRKSTSNEKMKDKSENQPNADHHGGMVENVLYDSSDKIAEGSISRTEGPLDNALYAMPDKRKTLDRELKSGAVDGSSAADILYGNSVIITQQGQNDHQGGDQYENVEMPGSGGGGNAEEIPLYEMPDKAPQRNTLKAPPKVDQTSTVPKKEVVNVDALYAEVDKTKKK